jgi:hypothetical protein
MIPVELWRVLHLFFAFSFVGTLVVADWNGRAARATQDWAQRSLLWGIVSNSAGIGGLGSLIVLGVLGNLLSVVTGYHMATDTWLRWANGLWLVAILVMAVAALPSVARLASLARAAAGGGSSEGYDAALRRWRIANIALSLLYLAALVLMVFRWKS